ncbi:hypothetical protein M406DRAFT_69597 [Cryphonectria parasitica EP155]|uniref:Phosphotransferase n=1 Tax=Cryphonectria parasitica (strain ATCC 38755 / EP155) TaxID=660469 RepID=A0A9P4Y6H7_CRYP1|nr:uncharacterized protein M406DRAFT_69597 [Cryphonectria parasitica EP155]KAF3767453.1 hypothetical protein M406DRAFT_69597 [Cryphonectria parasitica EP155]
MSSEQRRRPVSVEEFLTPLRIDDTIVHDLSLEMARTFTELSAKSEVQCLPTPISESLLRRVNGADRGRGGTNLRVGFIELLPEEARSHEGGVVNGSSAAGHHGSRLQRLLEQSWPIGEHLKNENPESLFSWIGQSIATVVRRAQEEWGFGPDSALPMGVTFSFPVVQTSVSQATIMSMGKGFAITSKLDLGSHLLAGYEQHRQDLPRITIAAIANDAIATLVSFIYQFQASPNQKAAMGLICGTGSNATVPLRLSSLHPSKRPETVSVLPGQAGEDVRLAVNTEWGINGTAPPLRKFGLISRWDTELDMAGEAPGFQPLEYMTSGRYLGELGRLIFVDYLTSVLGFEAGGLPSKLKTRFGLSTTFLSHFGPRGEGTLREQLDREVPMEKDKENMQSPSRWTDEIASALYQIAVAIEARAAGIVAASTVGLLMCAGELPSPSLSTSTNTITSPPPPAMNAENATELVVGYTGGCITGFQDYLKDCQAFLDKVVALEYGRDTERRVLLSPCHDGGIIGAGILVPASLHNIHTYMQLQQHQKGA